MRVNIGDGALFFDVDGPQWDYAGADFVRRPTVIVLHGGPGPDHRRGKAWARRLTDVAQVIYLDQRGHGLSDERADGAYSLAGWADDVAAFCAVLEIQRPIVLGVSFGGFVAQTLAIRHPELLRGLVLMSTSARNDLDRIVDAMTRFGDAQAATVARAFYAGPRDARTGADYVRLCMPLYTAAPAAAGTTPSEPWNAMLTALFTEPATGQFLHDDRREALGTVRTPTLILSGERDPITPVEAARELQAAFPPGVARIRTYPMASHAVPLDAPASLDDVCAFIRSLAA